MAAASLLTLLDDITAILDDVLVMSKLSAKKTAGVLGDDLALNAEQAIGLRAEREIPVILAVAKGSAKNKAILVPIALLLRTVAPWLVQPLLLLGGLFLCFEGVEKLLHKPDPDVVVKAETEEERIEGAVRTDFILSAEIIALTLGIVVGQDFLRALLVLVTISICMTIGVYGLVAAIIKLDDLGLHLQKSNSGFTRGLGGFILASAPRLLSLLSWVGTIAIFCVGGGIVSHSIAPLHHLLEAQNGVVGLVGEGIVGLVAGGIVALVVHFVQKIRHKG